MKYFILVVFCALLGHYLVSGDGEDDVKKECDEIGERALAVDDAINVTLRYLRAPEEYKDVVAACQEVVHCAAKMPSPDKEKFLEKFEMCDFYKFYNGRFAECATELIAKKDDNISCLNTLFNDLYEPEVNECNQWDGLQTCIKEQIENVCGEKSDDWVKHSKVYREIICEQEANQE